MYSCRNNLTVMEPWKFVLLRSTYWLDYLIVFLYFPSTVLILQFVVKKFSNI